MDVSAFVPKKTRLVVVAADIDGVAEGDPECVWANEAGLKCGLTKFGIVGQGDVVHEAYPDQIRALDLDRPRQGNAIIGGQRRPGAEDFGLPRFGPCNSARQKQWQNCGPCARASVRPALVAKCRDALPIEVCFGPNNGSQVGYLACLRFERK